MNDFFGKEDIFNVYKIVYSLVIFRIYVCMIIF